MTKRWDAARAASNRPLRKYKPVAPITCNFDDSAYYVKAVPFITAEGDYVRCGQCNYHVCNCGKPDKDITFRELSPQEEFEAAIYNERCGCQTVPYAAMLQRYTEHLPLKPRQVFADGQMHNGRARIWNSIRTLGAGFVNYCTEHQREHNALELIENALDALPDFKPIEKEVVISVSPALYEAANKRFPSPSSLMRLSSSPYVPYDRPGVCLVPRSRPRHEPEHGQVNDIPGAAFTLDSYQRYAYEKFKDWKERRELRGRQSDGPMLSEANILEELMRQHSRMPEYKSTATAVAEMQREVEKLCKEAAENMLRFGQPSIFIGLDIGQEVKPNHRLVMLEAVQQLPAGERAAAIHLLTTGEWDPPKEGP